VRTVTGSYVVHWLSPAGEVDMPVDLSHATVAVVAPPTFTPIYGSGSVDGTFTVPGVPVGDYYFDAGGHYYVMSGDTLDLQTYFVGHPGESVVTAPTNLTFDMTSLAPWQSGDELEIYAPTDGMLGFDLEAFAGSAAPMANDTTLTNFAWNLENADRDPLPSNDVATLAQLSMQTDGSRSYKSVSRTFATAPLTLSNGGNASVTGAFTTVNPTQTLTMTWDRPAFAAELDAHDPSTASQNWSTFAITALQGASTHGVFDEGPDVLVFAPGYSTDASAITTAWPYGDPFPSEWGRIAWLRFMKYRLIQLPGGSAAGAFSSIFQYVDLASLATQSTIEPAIGLVTTPKIGTADALTTTTITGMTTTPTLSWGAPTIGTAAKYYVNVRTVTVSNGATTLRTVAIFETTHTQVAIPPGVLQQSLTYVFEIQARASASDLVTTPLVKSLPDARSTLTTAMATP